MKSKDTFGLGFKGLKEKKIVAILTILSVAVGVASIVALVSQTTGIQTSVVNSLQQLGPTSILVTPSGPTKLTEADVAEISSLPGVSTVIPMVRAAANVTVGGQPTSVTIIGIDSISTLLGQVNLNNGNVYVPTTVPLAVVGYDVAFPIAGGPIAAYSGQPLIIQQTVGGASRTVTLQVAGVLNSYGSTPLIPIDDSIFLPLDAAMALFNRRSYNLLLVRASNVQSVGNVSQILTDIYGNNAKIVTIQQITQTVSSITGQFGLLLGSIAAISLTVAGLGIGSIMLVSVYQRTHEIGILKSVGFKGRNVMGLFLTESIIIGTVGGVIGLLSGSAVSYAIPAFFAGLIYTGRGTASARIKHTATSTTSFPTYTPIITPEIAFLSMLIALTVSIVAGLYPAWRASRMDPMKAIRSE
ncbi:MAG: ABC transporter permease [Nitrososphaerota archaeon]|nr:ABC transporter permease [Nitrososphaerota archaeon]